MRGYEPGATEHFSNVDELDQAAKALGWKIDYRQLSKGAFHARWTSMEAGSISLASAAFNNHVSVDSEPPQGDVGFFFPRLSAGRATVCGHDQQDNLLCMPPGAELDIVTQGQVACEALFLPASDFRAAAQELVGVEDLLTSRAAAIQAGDPAGLRQITRAIDSVREMGGVDIEMASKLLDATILWLADASSIQSVDQLARGHSASIAMRARSFIEEHLDEPIRLQDVCQYAGVGLRTLQRSFAGVFQVSPTLYLKVRRLDEARRTLAEAMPDECSVTDVAFDSGFAHLGRFSVEYRAHFGESPSTTLQRRRPARAARRRAVLV